MENLRKGFSMSNIRIRNMFLLVTALTVMFLLACGDTVVENSADESFSSISPPSVKEAPSTSEPTSTPEPISLSGEVKQQHNLSNYKRSYG